MGQSRQALVQVSLPANRESPPLDRRQTRARSLTQPFNRALMSLGPATNPETAGAHSRLLDRPAVVRDQCTLKGALWTELEPAAFDALTPHRTLCPRSLRVMASRDLVAPGF